MAVWADQPAGRRDPALFRSRAASYEVVLAN